MSVIDATSHIATFGLLHQLRLCAKFKCKISGSLILGQHLNTQRCGSTAGYT